MTSTLTIRKANIDIRFFTRYDFNKLLNEALDTETRNLIRITRELNQDPYDFLIDNSLELWGLLINDRPIYLAVLSKNKELWTIVNSNVKQQFSLFKYAKRDLYKWLDKYGVIYATMEKVNPKNMKWTERLGFKKLKEDNFTITYILQRS